MKCFIYMLCVLGLLLSGCVQRMDIEQGNIIEPAKARALHIGMTRAQVVKIMGTPMLTNPFQGNRLDYVYFFKPGYGATQEQRLSLIFRHGRLEKISSYHLH